MCVGGTCQCEPGKCGAATVVDLAGEDVGSYDVDDQFVYYSKGATAIYRAPVVGGAASLVTSDVKSIQEIRVAGADVVYTWVDGQATGLNKLRKVSAQGGQPTTLDSSPGVVAGVVTKYLAVRSLGPFSSVFWWANSKMNMIDVASGTKITSFTMGSNHPLGPIVASSSYVYAGTYFPAFYTFYRDGAAWAGHNKPSFNEFDLAVDTASNLYFTDTESGEILSITAMNDSPVYSGQSKLHGLAVDDTFLYWIKVSGMDYEILRGPKDGGSPTSLYKGQGLYSFSARDLRVRGGFVYWIADDKIWRVAP